MSAEADHHPRMLKLAEEQQRDPMCTPAEPQNSAAPVKEKQKQKAPLLTELDEILIGFAMVLPSQALRLSNPKYHS